MWQKAGMTLSSALFWDTTHRRFGTDRLSEISWNLKMEPIGCPERPVRNYHYSLHNIPEGRSLELRKNDALFVFAQTRALRVCAGLEVWLHVFLISETYGRKTWHSRPGSLSLRYEIPLRVRQWVGGGGCTAAVSKQMKMRTHPAQYVELVESYYAAWAISGVYHMAIWKD